MNHGTRGTIRTHRPVVLAVLLLFLLCAAIPAAWGLDGDITNIARGASIGNVGAFGGSGPNRTAKVYTFGAGAWPDVELYIDVSFDLIPLTTTAYLSADITGAVLEITSNTGITDADNGINGVKFVIKNVPAGEGSVTISDVQLVDAGTNMGIGSVGDITLTRVIVSPDIDIRKGGSSVSTADFYVHTPDLSAGYTVAISSDLPGGVTCSYGNLTLFRNAATIATTNNIYDNASNAGQAGVFATYSGNGPVTLRTGTPGPGASATTTPLTLRADSITVSDGSAKVAGLAAATRIAPSFDVRIRPVGLVVIPDAVSFDVDVAQNDRVASVDVMLVGSVGNLRSVLIASNDEGTGARSWQNVGAGLRLGSQSVVSNRGRITFSGTPTSADKMVFKVFGYSTNPATPASFIGSADLTVAIRSVDVPPVSPDLVTIEESLDRLNARLAPDGEVARIDLTSIAKNEISRAGILNPASVTKTTDFEFEPIDQPQLLLPAGTTAPLPSYICDIPLGAGTEGNVLSLSFLMNMSNVPGFEAWASMSDTMRSARLGEENFKLVFEALAPAPELFGVLVGDGGLLTWSAAIDRGIVVLSDRGITLNYALLDLEDEDPFVAGTLIAIPDGKKDNILRGSIWLLWVGDVPGGVVLPEAIDFNPASLILTQGESAMVNMVVRPADAYDMGVYMFVSNTSAINVSLSSGTLYRVDGLSAGTATITAVSKSNPLVSQRLQVRVESPSGGAWSSGGGGCATGTGMLGLLTAALAAVVTRRSRRG